MDKFDKIMLALALTFLICLLTGVFMRGFVTEARYYQCVYNIKSAGLTPTDLKAVCER